MESHLRSLLLCCIMFSFSLCLIEIRLRLLEQTATSDLTPSCISKRQDLQYNNVLTIPISIGTPPQSFNPVLNTGTFASWLSSTSSPKPFNKAQSITYKESPKRYNQSSLCNSIEGAVSQDSISLNDIKLSLIWILTGQGETPFQIEGEVGLGHKYSPIAGIEKPMSLMHQLITENFIRNNVFSIKKNTNYSNDSMLYIGGYHTDFTSETNAAKIASCALKNTEKWICTLSHIIFGQFSINDFKQKAVRYSIRASFETGVNKIVTPKAMLASFQLHFISNNCSISSSGQFDTLSCFNADSFADVAFVFNGYALKISREALFAFDPQSNAYASNIVFDRTGALDHIVIGMPFFNNRHVSFDYDTEVMKFYSEDNNSLTNISHYTNDDDFILSEATFLFPLILSAVLIVLLIVICTIRYRKKHKAKKEISLSPLTFPIISM